MTYNFENPHTHYQNGLDFHLDTGASYFLTQQLNVGAVAYFFQQVTSDRGLGATLGPFELSVAGVGPQLNYFFPVTDKIQGVVNVKAYWEFARRTVRMGGTRGPRSHLRPRHRRSRKMNCGKGFLASRPSRQPAPEPGNVRSGSISNIIPLIAPNMREVNSSLVSASCQLVGRSRATTLICLASSSARSFRQSASLRRERRSTCSTKSTSPRTTVCEEAEQLRPSELSAGLVLDEPTRDGEAVVGGERLDGAACAGGVLLVGRARR